MDNPKDRERKRDLQSGYEKQGYAPHIAERLARETRERENELRDKKDFHDD